MVIVSVAAAKQRTEGWCGIPRNGLVGIVLYMFHALVVVLAVLALFHVHHHKPGYLKRLRTIFGTKAAPTG
jgi:hypothetical protein